jgi:hypothetical protein
MRYALPLFSLLLLAGCDSAGTDQRSEPIELRIESSEYEDSEFGSSVEYRIVPDNVSGRQAYAVENVAIGSSGQVQDWKTVNVLLSPDSALAVRVGLRPDTARVYRSDSGDLIRELVGDSPPGYPVALRIDGGTLETSVDSIK